MSERDKKILSRLQITQSVIKEALNVTQQAVSKGINASSHYLGVDRLRRVVGYLRENNQEDVADDVLSLCSGGDLDFHESELAALRREQIDLKVNNPADTHDFETMWIVAKEPEETKSRHYFRSMIGHFASGDKSFAYFISDSTASSRFADKLSLKDDDERRASVRIYQSELFSLMPHMIFINPEDERESRGYAKTEAGTFVRLNRKDTERMIDGLLILMKRLDQSPESSPTEPLQYELQHEYSDEG